MQETQCSTLFYFCRTGSVNFNNETKICSREIEDRLPAFVPGTCPPLVLLAMKKTSDVQKETVLNESV